MSNLKEKIIQLSFSAYELLTDYGKSHVEIVLYSDAEEVEKRADHFYNRYKYMFGIEKELGERIEAKDKEIKELKNEHGDLLIEAARIEMENKELKELLNLSLAYVEADKSFPNKELEERIKQKI